MKNLGPLLEPQVLSSGIRQFIVFKATQRSPPAGVEQNEGLVTVLASFHVHVLPTLEAPSQYVLIGFLLEFIYVVNVVLERVASFPELTEEQFNTALSQFNVVFEKRKHFLR